MTLTRCAYTCRSNFKIQCQILRHYVKHIVFIYSPSLQPLLLPHDFSADHNDSICKLTTVVTVICVPMRCASVCVCVLFSHRSNVNDMCEMKVLFICTLAPCSPSLKNMCLPIEKTTATTTIKYIKQNRTEPNQNKKEIEKNTNVDNGDAHRTQNTRIFTVYG